MECIDAEFLTNVEEDYGRGETSSKLLMDIVF